MGSSRGTQSSAAANSRGRAQRSDRTLAREVVGSLCVAASLARASHWSRDSAGARAFARGSFVITYPAPARPEPRAPRRVQFAFQDGRPAWCSLASPSRLASQAFSLAHRLLPLDSLAGG